MLLVGLLLTVCGGLVVANRVYDSWQRSIVAKAIERVETQFDPMTKE